MPYKVGQTRLIGDKIGRNISGIMSGISYGMEQAPLEQAPQDVSTVVDNYNGVAPVQLTGKVVEPGGFSRFMAPRRAARAAAINTGVDKYNVDAANEFALQGIKGEQDLMLENTRSTNAIAENEAKKQDEMSSALKLQETADYNLGYAYSQQLVANGQAPIGTDFERIGRRLRLSHGDKLIADKGFLGAEVELESGKLKNEEAAFKNSVAPRNQVIWEQGQEASNNVSKMDALTKERKLQEPINISSGYNIDPITGKIYLSDTGGNRKGITMHKGAPMPTESYVAPSLREVDAMGRPIVMRDNPPQTPASTNAPVALDPKKPLVGKRYLTPEELKALRRNFMGGAD